MSRLLQLTSIDVRRAEVAGSSRPLIVNKLTIPPVTLMSANHNPGGGVMGVDFSIPRIEALEPAFEYKGFDTDIFDGMGKSNRWVFAGALKDRKTGAVVPARCVIEGTVVAWEPDDADPSEFVGCNAKFQEVTHFEHLVDGEELIYADFWERVLRFKGVDLFAEDRAALGS